MTAHPPRGPGDPPPKRVRVTSPRRTAAAPGPVRVLATELAETTALAEVYVETHMRRQLRTAVVALLLPALVVGGVAAVFALVPAAQAVTVGAVPLSWIALGALACPTLLLAALLYLRTCERAERDFARWRRRG